MGRKRVANSTKNKSSKTKSPATKARGKLDEFLPLLSSEQAEIHLHAAVLEVAEMSQLVELAADLKIRRFLLARLSDTAALVDPGQAKALEDALLAGGHTPKRLEGEWK
jgi:hypothetical protein